MLCISAGLHWYVYANLKRLLLRDYPKIGKKLAHVALWIFIALDLPFIFIYISGSVHSDITALSRILLYPFLIWQTIMLMWVIILLPFTLFRRLKKLFTNVFQKGHHIRKGNDHVNGSNLELDVVPE